MSERETERAIPWILRRDLEVFHADERDGAWTIKDPVRLKYFRVESAELEFLKMLDGKGSLEAALERLSRLFPDFQFVAANLTSFLITAIRSELLIPVDVGYGQELATRAQHARTAALIRKPLTLISHRFRGIDPTRFLRTLDRWTGWIYHRSVLSAAAVFVVVTACLVLTRWSQVVAELPAISELFTVHTVLMLGLAVVCIKVLHEIGHGLTCCHYGGECHELGCLLVGFLPLLYCDVSDSWKQRHRVQRIQVAAAGIAVELFLAAICAVLWLASIPGPLHTLFLNIMLLCSLNTLLINGNPLLRYDGYYILSDLLRIPNLGPESRAAAYSLFDRVVLGISDNDSMVASHRRVGLAAFGVASMLYRVLVLTTILLFIYGLLKPHGLELVAWLLTASTAAGLLTMQMAMIRQRVRRIRNAESGAVRALTGLVLLGGALGIGLFAPLPYSVEAPFTLTPGAATPVYVSTPGFIETSVPYGTPVVADQVLVTLHNSDLQLQLVQLEGDLALQEAHLDHLNSIRVEAPVSAIAIPAAERAVQHTDARLQTLKQKMARLSLRSPSSGVVLPPRNRPAREQTQTQQQFWHGVPLDRTNSQAWFTEQTLLGWVGTPDQMRATVYIPQEQIEFVSEGAHVHATFNASPGDPLSGSVAEIRNQADQQVPPELVAANVMSTGANDSRVPQTRFTVHARLDANNEQFPPLYSTGVAQIECHPRSLAARIWRLLAHTFAFEI